MSTTNQAWIVDYSLDAVVAVDLTTGDRTVLSDASKGSGPLFASPSKMVVHDDRLLILDEGLGILAVNPSTGDRSDGSTATRGWGPPIGYVHSIALLPNSDVAFVYDSKTRTMLAVDLTPRSHRVVARLQNDLALAVVTRSSRLENGW